MAEPIEMLFGLWTWVGPRKCVACGAHWRHLSNTIEPCMCWVDAAFLSKYFDHLFVCVYHVLSSGHAQFQLITFCVSRRRHKMYCGHPRLSVCLCLSAAACLHYCTDPDVTWRSGRGCPLVVHYWVDLQSVHGFPCYGNTIEMSDRAQR